MVYFVRFFWLVYEQSGACYNLKSILLEHTTTTSTRNHVQGAVPYSTFQVAKLLHSFLVWTQTLLASGHPRVARGVWDPDYIRIDYASCNRFIV